MSVKLEYQWPNLTPETEHLCERFERDLLPYLEKMGPFIGELAQGGWKVAEEIMIRHQGFVHGMPEARQYNLAMLMGALSVFQEKWEDVRRENDRVMNAMARGQIDVDAARTVH